MKNRILGLPNLSGYQASKMVAVSFSQMATTTPKNLRGSTVPDNEEAVPVPTAEAQQDVARAREKLSCRTRLMGPLLVLGALGALVAQAKPAMARKRTSAERAIGQRSVCWRRDGTIRQGMLAVRARCPGVL
jgi:hypothetical protein